MEPTCESVSKMYIFSFLEKQRSYPISGYIFPHFLFLYWMGQEGEGMELQYMSHLCCHLMVYSNGLQSSDCCHQQKLLERTWRLVFHQEVEATALQLPPIVAQATVQSPGAKYAEAAEPGSGWQEQ